MHHLSLTNPAGASVLDMDIADERVASLAHFLERNMGALLAVKGAWATVSAIQDLFGGITMQQRRTARPARVRRRRKALR